MNRRKFIETTLLVAPFSLLPANQRKIRKIRKKISFRGKVKIDGKVIKNRYEIKVHANSKIEIEGKESFVQFKVGQDAFKLSKDTDVKFSGDKHIASINVKKGRLLGAFKTGRQRKITTVNATMGIRGTAVFVEAVSDKETKFCTCYGKTTVSDKSNSKSLKELEATHHNSVQILDGKVEKTSLFYGLEQFIYEPTHSDNELRGLEYMVGRVPAFDKDGKSPFIEL